MKENSKPPWLQDVEWLRSRSLLRCLRSRASNVAGAVVHSLIRHWNVWFRNQLKPSGPCRGVSWWCLYVSLLTSSPAILPRNSSSNFAKIWNKYCYSCKSNVTQVKDREGLTKEQDHGRKTIQWHSHSWSWWKTGRRPVVIWPALMEICDPAKDTLECRTVRNHFIPSVDNRAIFHSVNSFGLDKRIQVNPLYIGRAERGCNVK